MAKKLFRSLQAATKDVDRAIKLGVKRSLNRTASSTRTYVSKQIRTEIGLKARDVNAKVRTNKTQSGFNKKHSFRSSVGIAMRAILPMRVFSPKTKKVRTKKGPRVGVTVKIGKLGRFIVPSAFMIVKKITLVAERKGRKRRPTREVHTMIWQETVTTQYGSYTRYAKETFDRIVDQQVQYAIDSREKQSKNEN